MNTNSAGKPPRRSREHLNRVSVDSNGYYSENRNSRNSLFKRKSQDEFIETPSDCKYNTKEDSG